MLSGVEFTSGTDAQFDLGPGWENSRLALGACRRARSKRPSTSGASCPVRRLRSMLWCWMPVARGRGSSAVSPMRSNVVGAPGARASARSVDCYLHGGRSGDYGNSFRERATSVPRVGTGMTRTPPTRGASGVDGGQYTVSRPRSRTSATSAMIPGVYRGEQNSCA